MHYAIIAAGTGSRLASLGPKPLVSPAGQTLIARLLNILCSRPDAESIAVVTSPNFPEVARHIASLSLPIKPEIIEELTSGAAISLFLASKMRPCIALTVDSVFIPQNFNRFADEFAKSSNCLMAVTSYIDDEKPLYVETDPDMNVTAFSDSPGAHFVSAGIYGLNAQAIDLLRRPNCHHGGSLRDFQRELITCQIPTRAFDIGTAIDLDRPADLPAARQLIIQNPITPTPKP